VSRVACATIVLLAVLSTAGCRAREGGEDVDTSQPSEFGFQTSIKTSKVEEGKIAYRRHCIGCHGIEGDGKGEAAKFFYPKPRNFQKANFKFSSTRSGRLPTDADLKRTIKNGLKGSAMPPFDLLPGRTVDALLAYIKTFSPKWEEQAPSPPIPIVDDPYRPLADKSEAIARGARIFHGYANCWSCHPAYVDLDALNGHRTALGFPTYEYVRDNFHQSAGKPNAEGEIIFPPDFRRDHVRSGASVDNLYRSIASGITGTAMPTWVDSMSVPGRAEGDPPVIQPSDLWAIAYYVQSLIASRPARLAEGTFQIRDRRKTIYLHGEPPPVTPPPEPDMDEEEDFDFDES